MAFFQVLASVDLLTLAFFEVQYSLGVELIQVFLGSNSATTCANPFAVFLSDYNFQISS
jgi:hypothetical protein